MIELKEHTVVEALANEEIHREVAFIPRDLRVDDARAKFAEEPILQALVITHSGRDNEKHIGIGVPHSLS
jgi:hypothetical protein